MAVTDRAPSRASVEPLPQPSPPRHSKARFSLADRIMRLSDIGLGGWAIIVYGFLYLPIVVLVAFSFNDESMSLYWTHFTTKWYWMKQAGDLVGVIHDQALISAFITSMEIAILSTLIAVLIATIGSFALERFKFRSRGFWDGLNYTKIIIAEIVAGVSTEIFFVQLNRLLTNSFGFNLFGIFSLGFGTILIAHVAWNIPFCVIIIRARLKGFDRAIEEAGADLGARPVTVFRTVTLPIIMPGILAASLLSFTLSFDDFITSFFVAGANVTTLPMLLWSRVRLGVTPELNAIATLMVVSTAIVVVILELKARVSQNIV
jgi:spermidine/putrescine transport system permease protein